MLSWTWIARSCYGPAGRPNADEPSFTGPVQIYLLARQPNASTFSTRSSRNGTNESKLRRIDTISVAFPENGFLISFSPSFIKETITNIPTYQDGWNNVEEKIIRWVNFFFFFPLNRKIYIVKCGLRLRSFVTFHFRRGENARYCTSTRGWATHGRKMLASRVPRILTLMSVLLARTEADETRDVEISQWRNVILDFQKSSRI